MRMVVVMVMMVMLVIEIDGQHHRGAAGAVIIQDRHHDMRVMGEMPMVQVPDDI